MPLLKISARRRIAQLMKHYHLDDTPWPGQVEMNVASVNELTPDELEQWPYQLVVIHGTRILSAELIERLQKTVLNIHTGFTPHYRGVHGMYWALCMNDAAHCGVTVHRVEKGIDTGRVLSRKLLTPSAHDNFCSYPWLQLAEGLSELDKSIRAVLGNNWPVVSEEGKGKLWYHPTWRQYLYFRWFKGVK